MGCEFPLCRRLLPRAANLNSTQQSHTEDEESEGPPRPALLAALSPRAPRSPLSSPHTHLTGSAYSGSAPSATNPLRNTPLTLLFASAAALGPGPFASIPWTGVRARITAPPRRRLGPAQASGRPGRARSSVATATGGGQPMGAHPAASANGRGPRRAARGLRGNSAAALRHWRCAGWAAAGERRGAATGRAWGGEGGGLRGCGRAGRMNYRAEAQGCERDV